MKRYIAILVLTVSMLMLPCENYAQSPQGRFAPTRKTQGTEQSTTNNRDLSGQQSGRFAPSKRSGSSVLDNSATMPRGETTTRNRNTQAGETVNDVRRGNMSSNYYSASSEPRLTGKTIKDRRKYEILQRLIDNMVEIDGGSFYMGATSEQQADAYDTEAPMHYVTVSSFFLNKYEVSQAEWNAVMDQYPSNYYGEDKDDYPVEMVSWVECQEFIDKLNDLTGLRFRLPTDAEWEYAARGGVLSNGYKYSGANDVDCISWHKGNSDQHPHPVGTRGANELGLYDMNGNVWEWCQDWYANDYFAKSNGATNPVGPISGRYKIIRGGSWFDDIRLCRTSSRYMNIDTNFDPGTGLRLAMDVDW